MSERSKKKINRRTFLKIVGLSSASILSPRSLREGLSANESPDKSVSIRKESCVIYHTSTRKRKACNACKKHSLNKIFSSKEAANANRAHPGCNCKIVKEKISRQNYVNAFLPGSKGGTEVYDKRNGWPPSLLSKDRNT